MFHFLFRYCFRRQSPTQGSLVWDFRLHFCKHMRMYESCEGGPRALTTFSKSLKRRKRLTGANNKAECSGLSEKPVPVAQEAEQSLGVRHLSELSVQRGDSCEVAQASTDLATRERPLGKPRKTGRRFGENISCQQEPPPEEHSFLPPRTGPFHGPGEQFPRWTGKKHPPLLAMLRPELAHGGLISLMCGKDADTNTDSTASNKNIGVLFCCHKRTGEDNIALQHHSQKTHPSYPAACLQRLYNSLVRPVCTAVLTQSEAHMDTFP